MANVTGSSSSSSALQGLQAAPNTITYITITFIIAILAIILNSIEIHLIRQKWKKATDFEVLLLNLGIADLLSGIGYVVIASLSAVAYVTKSSRTRGYSLAAFDILGFTCILSTKLVLVIGIERFLAIRLPLKHRLWHTSRKTMCKRIFAIWVASFIYINAAVLSDYFIQKSKGQKVIISRNLGYALAAYLTLGVCAVFVIYSWLSRLVIMRSTKLLNFDKKDYKINPKAIRKAIKKEKATIIICRLVAATFLVCNIPIIVGLYRGKFDSVSVSFQYLNAVMNPLIYFFKGYAEKWYTKKKLAVSSSDTGGSNDNLDSPSPKVTKPESSLEMKKVNKTKEDNLAKLNGQGSDSSRNEGERLKNRFDATQKAEPNDQESEGSRIKGKERQSYLQPSVEKGTENTAGNGDLCGENDQESRSSKDRGEDQREILLNKLDSFVDVETANFAGNDDLCVKNDQESGNLKDKGEGEILRNKLDSVVNVEIVDLAGNGDLCTVNGQDLESLEVKGEGSSGKPDSTVEVNITKYNEHDESLKATGPSWNIDGPEHTQL